MEQSCRETWISVADTAVLLKIKPNTADCQGSCQ